MVLERELTGLCISVGLSDIKIVSGSSFHTVTQIKGMLGQPLEGIILKNVDLQSDEALFCSGIESIQMRNVNLRNS